MLFLHFLRKGIVNLALVAVLLLLFSLTSSLNAMQLVRVQSQNVKSAKVSDSNFSNGSFFVDLHYNPAFTRTTQENGVTIANSDHENLLQVGEETPVFKFDWLSAGLGVGYKFANGFTAVLDLSYMNLASDWDPVHKRYRINASIPKIQMKSSKEVAIEAANRPPYKEAGVTWRGVKEYSNNNEGVPEFEGSHELTPNIAQNKVGYAKYEGIDSAKEREFIDGVNRVLETPSSYYNYEGLHLISGLVKFGYNYDFMDNLGIYGDLGLGTSYLIVKGSLQKEIPNSFQFTGNTGIGASFILSEKWRIKLGYNLSWTPIKEFLIKIQDPEYSLPQVTFIMTSRAVSGKIKSKRGVASPPEIQYAEQNLKVKFGHLISHSANLVLSFNF